MRILNISKPYTIPRTVMAIALFFIFGLCSYLTGNTNPRPIPGIALPCFTLWTIIYMHAAANRLCGLMLRVPGYRCRVRFAALPDFLGSTGSVTGSTKPRQDNWGATWMKRERFRSIKPRLMAVWIRCAGHSPPSNCKIWQMRRQFNQYYSFAVQQPRCLFARGSVVVQALWYNVAASRSDLPNTPAVIGSGIYSASSRNYNQRQIIKKISAE
jgi:hypothetical protein